MRHDENPDMHSGSVQSEGNDFISLIWNSSTSSVCMPNYTILYNIIDYYTSSFPPVTAIIVSVSYITLNLVLYWHRLRNSLQIPLVTSNTSIDVMNFSLKPAIQYYH
jgi:hypothetical protein